MFTKSGVDYKNIKFDNKLLIGAEKAVNYKGVLIITEETVSGMNCRKWSRNVLNPINQLESHELNVNVITISVRQSRSCNNRKYLRNGFLFPLWPFKSENRCWSSSSIIAITFFFLKTSFFTIKSIKVEALFTLHFIIISALN
jgi:hypothetical protein